MHKPLAEKVQIKPDWSENTFWCSKRRQTSQVLKPARFKGSSVNKKIKAKAGPQQPISTELLFKEN